MASFAEHLHLLERTLADTPTYDAITAALRGLKAPTDVGAEELTRLYAAMFDILGLQAPRGGPQKRFPGLDERQLRHLQGWAREIVEWTIYDPHSRQRASIAGTRALYASRGQPPPEGLDESERGLAQVVSAPWDAETAYNRLQPLLSSLEDECRRNPTAHLRLSWQVWQSGYPVYRDVFQRWWRHLESRSVIPSGFRDALVLCSDLLAVRDAGELPTWGQCEDRYLPLLDHPHPMVRAAAAIIVGQFYGNGAHRSEPEVAPLLTMLEVVKRREAEMRGVAGGFVAGFSEENFDGLYAFDACEELRAAQFDTSAWVLDVVKASSPEEPYLPTAQAFWFYVHEYFDTKPAAVGALIDLGRDWLAMMCATEIGNAVEGMKPVLERLATSSNPEIASGARDHLARHYQGK